MAWWHWADSWSTVLAVSSDSPRPVAPRSLPGKAPTAQEWNDCSFQGCWGWCILFTADCATRIFKAPRVSPKGLFKSLYHDSHRQSLCLLSQSKKKKPKKKCALCEEDKKTAWNQCLFHHVVPCGTVLCFWVSHSFLSLCLCLHMFIYSQTYQSKCKWSLWILRTIFRLRDHSCIWAWQPAHNL